MEGCFSIVIIFICLIGLLAVIQSPGGYIFVIIFIVIAFGFISSLVKDRRLTKNTNSKLDEGWSFEVDKHGELPVRENKITPEEKATIENDGVNARKRRRIRRSEGQKIYKIDGYFDEPDSEEFNAQPGNTLALADGQNNDTNDSDEINVLTNNSNISNLPTVIAEKNETKLCPYCAEEIKFAAIKCKHCGSMIDKAQN